MPSLRFWPASTTPVIDRSLSMRSMNPTRDEKPMVRAPSGGLISARAAPAVAAGGDAVAACEVADGMRQQNDLRALQRQDAPRLEEVCIVANRDTRAAESEVDHVPFVRLAEAEELVVRGMHLALHAQQ